MRHVSSISLQPSRILARSSPHSRSQPPATTDPHSRSTHRGLTFSAPGDSPMRPIGRRRSHLFVESASQSRAPRPCLAANNAGAAQYVVVHPRLQRPTQVGRAALHGASESAHRNRRVLCGEFTDRRDRIARAIVENISMRTKRRDPSRCCRWARSTRTQQRWRPSTTTVLAAGGRNPERRH